MKHLVCTIVAVLLIVGNSFACTSAVISGKATRDGRPILWKHRDSDVERNKLRYFRGGKYDFIGIVNSDTLETEVWVGSNSAGFSIMNTVAYNVNIGEKCNVPDDQEGILMREALSSCATLAEFERMLDETKGKRGVAANFGVIDAQGGAAYYEVGYYTMVKYDANDPQVAPHGYLLRTNFAISGDTAHGKGFIRYAAAQELFTRYSADNKFSVEFILAAADRNLKHSLVGTDLSAVPFPEEDTTAHFVPFRDYIVRNSTVSSMIVQGVVPGEDPRLTTLWTVLGFPLTTIVTPVWVAGGEILPEVTLAKNGGFSPLNEVSLQLKKRCFPMEIDNGRDYLNLAAVMNSKGTGIFQRLQEREKEIVSRAETLVTKWMRDGFDREEAVRFYQWLDQYVAMTYSSAFGLSLR